MQQEKEDVLALTKTGVDINTIVCKTGGGGYGNAAIILEMVDNQELDDQGVLDYLEYTNYINDN